MATVMSPALTYDGRFWCMRGTDWFCPMALRRLFAIPDTVRRLWVEGNKRQWADGSGMPIEVRLLHDSPYDAQWRDGTKWSELLPAVSQRLKRMGIGDIPTTIYVCVWYEE